jgi:hypothetical protein
MIGHSGAMTDQATPDEEAGLAPLTPQEEAELAAMTIVELFGQLVDDDDAAGARERYCETVSSALENVGSWLEVDSWVGAGDVEDAEANDSPTADPIRRRSFAAVALVAEISSELVSGALLLFRSGNEYAASALVRQLIECEYLLQAFRLNFAEAARWHDANDKERWDFTPSKLRKIGGFDRKEYGDHCEAGGHPHPSGRQLMELPRAMGDLERAASGRTEALNTVRALWLDFTFHCDRTWRALADLLAAEHARFERVGRTTKSIEAVAESRLAWQQSDPLALCAGEVLAALEADPTTRLGDLLGSED